jgi:hypothetical protein
MKREERRKKREERRKKREERSRVYSRFGRLLDFGQITRSYEQYLNGFAPFEAVPDSAYRIALGFDVNGILAKLPSYSSNGHPAMSQLWREARSVSVYEFRHSGGIGGQHPKFVQSPKGYHDRKFQMQMFW